MYTFSLLDLRKAQVWLLLTKKLKQRNATAHTEWRQAGGPVGMRWVRAMAAASPALRSHERVITVSLTPSHISLHLLQCASASLHPPPPQEDLFTSMAYASPSYAVCFCLTPHPKLATNQLSSVFIICMMYWGIMSWHAFRQRKCWNTLPLCPWILYFNKDQKIDSLIKAAWLTLLFNVGGSSTKESTADKYLSHHTDQTCAGEESKCLWIPAV